MDKFKKLCNNGQDNGSAGCLRIPEPCQQIYGCCNYCDDRKYTCPDVCQYADSKKPVEMAKPQGEPEFIDTGFDDISQDDEQGQGASFPQPAGDEEDEAKKRDAAIKFYGQGLNSDTEVIWKEAIDHIQEAQKNILEAGRRFIVLKEVLGYGNFIKELENRNLDERRVRELMLITYTFADRRALADLGKTKLLVLARLSDEELEEAEKSGIIAGHTLDEVKRMPYRELKAALEASQKEVQKLRKKNEALQEENSAELGKKKKDQLRAIADAKEAFLSTFIKLQKVRLENADPVIINELVMFHRSLVETSQQEYKKLMQRKEVKAILSGAGNEKE